MAPTLFVKPINLYYTLQICLGVCMNISVLVAGAAGDGIKKAGNTVARVLNRLGYFVFVMDDYQSLIRGGHNFSVVTASDKPIHSHSEKIDIVVATNLDSYNKHSSKLKQGGVFIGDISVDGVLNLPMRQIARENQLLPVSRITVGLGALAHFLNIEKSVFYDVFDKTYGKNSDSNKKLFDIGYSYFSNEPIYNISKIGSPKPLITGNQAVALGAVRAGLKVYIAYPMTPATSILHTLASVQKEYNIAVIQAENEIGVANMGLGAAYTGARTMVGTSGGGFALMNETFSLTGMAEVPLVYVEVQRPGPATGVPTYTSQGDLEFVLHAGHGEFPRIVLAPGDIEDAFYMAGQALNLAWKYQVPVILLSDKHIAESTSWVSIDETRITPGDEKRGHGMKRYLITDDGISPLTFPGIPGDMSKTTSYEHDEFGYTTEDPSEIVKMIDKRARKEQTIINEMDKYNPLSVFEGDGETVVVSWGSPKGAILDVQPDFGFKYVQIKWLRPFPSKQLESILSDASKIINIENNSSAPLSKLIRRETGFDVDKNILKYDGRPFTADILKSEFEKVI